MGTDRTNTRISPQREAAIAAAWPSILSAVAAGERYTLLAERHGFSYDMIRGFRAKDPQRRAEWEDATRDSAAALLDEHLRTMRDTSIDPARARVVLASLQWLIEKLDPDRFGQRTRLDVRQTLDLSQALTLAAQRVSDWRAARPLLTGVTVRALSDLL